MANLHVNLAFSADTGKAKAQIQELQTLLNKIAYTGTTSNNLTGNMQKDIQAASAAAKDLQFHLNNAFNTTTGKFDLSLLDRSLKTSGANITDLSTKLLGAGATGQQAFMKLAQSISLADQPMFRISNRMKEFAVTMKNTVKWQLSSSMLHGFMGAIQSAYGYAQDLNKSLTDIRIVTGYSADQMAKFAEQANKAAKSLSTTTTDYTNASLIYFQQGLSDSEVTERTAVTVKMANAAGESAQIVSDQLTAVWNNFYDGSKSLEYYADVMTALGAATASSTDEISEGLSKFAAVAETVGLSYEYATAALTTITSNTRESADVVGNALKTLFARIQGLKLGETLEDGVDLNKYSEALDKAGISIFESNGELKAMDDILTELASRWDTMSNTQQVALAQTVAGVRQYTQLIALMENWDNGDADSMMANLRTIESSEGALNKQADIYAQSWEAASKRVQAAAQGIYQSLLDDDFFITLNNGFANLLGGINAFIDGAGGLKTILISIASVVMSSFANKIPAALDTLKYNLEVVTKGSQKAYERIQNQMKAATEQAFNKFNQTAGQQGIQKDSAMGYAIEQANELTAARNKLAMISDRMSASEKQAADVQLGLIAAQQEEVVALKEKNEVLRASIELQRENIRNSQVDSASKSKSLKSSEEMSSLFLQYNDMLQNAQERVGQILTIPEADRTQRQSDNLTRLNAEIEQYEQLTTATYNFSRNYQDAMQQVDSTNNRIGQSLFQAFSSETFDESTEYVIQFSQEFRYAFDAIEETLLNTNLDFNDSLNIQMVQQQLKALQNTIPETVQQVTGLDMAFNRVFSAMNEAELLDAFEYLQNDLANCTIEGSRFQTVLEGLYGRPISQISSDMRTLAANTELANQKASILKTLLAEFQPTHVVRMSEAMGALAGLMGNIVTIGNSIKSIITSLGNPDLSGWEKFSAVLTGFSMIIPAVNSGLQNAVIANEFLSGSFKKSALALVADAAGKTTNVVATKLLAAANTALNASFGPLLIIIAAIAAAILVAVLAFKKLKQVIDAIRASSFEGQLEAAEEATRGMATAAKDATTAYQELLSTISGYDSAISALEGLEVGTQEFTNALITANEKAWELIDAYGLIQGQDWDYGKNGEIIINNSAKNRITKEANDIREDAVIAHSAAQIQEKEAAYNVSRSNAGMVGYDIQQGYLDQNVLYDALGLTDGSFKHTKDAIQQWQEEGIFNADVADKIAQSLYGADWLDLDSSQLEYINNNIFKYLDEIEAMFGDFSQYNLAKENQFDKQVSTVMSDEEAYQKTSWKSAVNDYLESSFENAKQEALAEYEDDTDDQINAAYEDYLKKTYIEEDGKYYRKDASGNKTGEAVEGLTGLSPEAQKNILATVDAWQVLEDKGIEMAQSFNGIANDMTDSEKDVADALLNGDFSSLTEKQIEAFNSGELSLEEAIGSSNYQQLAMLLGEDYIQQLENGFKEAINNWQPPEFDLESWKSDYQSKMDAIGEIDEYGRIDAEDYALLAEEYSEYFDVQADGSAILNVKASEFKSIVEGIELGKLKEEIANLSEQQQDAVNNVSKATGWDERYSENRLNSAAQSWTKDGITKSYAQNQLNTEHAQALAESLEIDLTQYDSAVEKINALGQAWLDLNNNLNNSQQTMASTATSLDELRGMFNEGTINIEEYNSAMDSTIAKEAEVEDLDYNNILEYAEYLSENADKLEDVDNALQGNLKTAKQVALVQAKLNKAVKTLSDNWDDWNKAIKSGDMDQIMEYLPNINDALKDMLDLTDEAFEGLSDDFAVKNWDKIKDVVNGVEGALEDLQVESAKDYAINLGLSESQITEEMTSLMSELTLMAEGTELTVEPGIDNANAFDGLYELLTQAGFTADQIADIFDKLGWDPEITYKEMPFSEAQNYVGGGYQEILVPVDGGGWEKQAISLAAENGISGETIVKVPVIKGTKTSGGSGSYTPKNTSSGGGGGGGQKKHAEKKSSSEKTRYHTIQNQLEDLKDEYDEISDAADRAFGQDKLDAIDDQINKTDELIDKQEEYLDAISENLPKDKAIMDAYYDKIIKGPKIEYDERGNIANYDEIQDAMFKKYNQMTEKYTDDSEEWQQFEKQYEKLEKYIEQYEETYDLLREEEAEYQELLNQRLDLQLEKVEYGVELNLNINEDDLAILEFQLDLLEDKAFESANRIALSTKQASNLYDQILINQKGLEDALGLSLSPGKIAEMMQGDMSVLEGKTFTEAQIDAIKDYRDNLLDLNSELIDIQKQVEEEVLTAFDEWHEELDRGIEKFDHYGNILESYKNIIDIVGKDALGLDNENIAKLSEAQVNNSINRLKANKDAYDSYQKSAEEAENKMKKAQEDATAARLAGNEELAKSYDEDAEFWKETAQEMSDFAQEAQEELMDNWGNTLEVIVSQFEEAVERAIETFNDAIYELGGLEGLSADFGRAKEDDDTYLDDYQKIYELSKLTRDINNKIDDTDIIAGKQKLKALLEDINELQEDGVEMSQYDLEYLQATYDLRLAELELEEARNAKNTVRLQKDNEGNWSYIYTQNTDAVDSAQQKYEDALYAMQDLSTNYIDEMSEKLISTSQEMQEALAAVRIEDYASIEEYYAELDRIERLYTERMSKQQVELQKGLDNNKTLYNTDWLNYSEATGYKISKAEEFAQAFSNTMLGQLTNTDTVDAFGQLITSATTTLVSGLTTAATTYYQNIGLATEAAGSSITDFADLLEEDIEAIKSKSGEAASSVEDMATRMDTAMTDIIDKVAGWQEEYGREIDKIINKNLRVIETYNNMIKALSGASGKITISYDVDSTTSSPVDVGTTVPEGTAQAATGGYTGNWGSNEGKLAILHQRELILNELDTSNFLQALEITRQIMSVIDIQAKQASLGLGAITASTLKDEKPKEILEQEVHITAEFPNVNNHYEIEEAFNTLINTASQYANRK